MLQSFSIQPQYRQQKQKCRQLLCNKCKKKPDEFILLLCDHVICGLCLNMVNSIKGQYGFDGVRCICGVVTYFNMEKLNKIQDRNQNWDELENYGEENCHDRFSHKNGVQVKIHSRNVYGQQKERRNQQVRHSVGLIKSKETASTKNMSRLYTESYCNQEKMIGDRLMLQRSNYPLEWDISEQVQNTKMLLKKEKDQKRRNHNGLVRQKNILHSQKFQADQDSLIDEIVTEKENVQPNQRKTYAKHSKNHFRKKIFEESNSEQEDQGHMSKIRKGNILSEQLKSQISFLQVQHRKWLQTLNRTYNRVLRKINDDYLRLQNSLKDLCLEKVLLQNNESHVDIGKIVKLRYDGYIANNLQKLIQEIKKFNLPDCSNSIRGLSNRVESHVEMPQYERNRIERRDGINRFSSPQPFCKSHILSEPVSIYSPKTQKYLGSLSKQIPPWVQNNCTVYNPNLTVKNSSHYAQIGDKFHKKNMRHRTNVIIQL